MSTLTIFEMKQAFSLGKTIFDLPLNVSFYARVSTEKEEQINSLENQVTFFEEYIKQNKNWNFIKGYIDEGISGTTSAKRENFMKMIEEGKQKRFDLLITKEVSRFSRDTIDSLVYTRKLLEYDVCVYFLSDNIITASSDGELRLTIISSMAQDEVRKISERTKFGFKRAVEKGTVLGSNNIWGYKKDKGKLVIDEEEATLIKKIFNMYANDNKIGLKKLSENLASQGFYNHNDKPFHQNTLKKIIQNPKYKGYYTGKLSTVIDYRTKKRNFYDKKEWITYKDLSKVPPIVSEELWDKANYKLLKRGKVTKANVQTKYPLSGKVYCNKHKCSFVRKIRHYKNKPDVIYWYCSKFHKTGKKECSPAYIREADIYGKLVEQLNQYKINKQEICKDLLNLYKNVFMREEEIVQRKSLEQEQNKLIKKKEKLLDLALDKVFTKEEVEKKNIELTSKISQIQEKLNQQEIGKNKINEYLKVLEQNILTELEISIANVEEYIDVLIDKIIVEESGNNECKLKLILKNEYEIKKKSEFGTFHRICDVPGFGDVPKIPIKKF